MTTNLLSYCVAVLALGQFLVGCSSLDTTNWRELHYAVYTTDKKLQMEPEEVRQHLEELAVIYEPYSDEQTNGRKHRVETLLEVSRIVDEHCKRDKFVVYDKLLEYNSPYEINILPYLEHYSLKQFEHCRLHAIDWLYAGVKRLTAEQKEDLAMLDATIAEATLDGLSRSERHRIERVPGPELELTIVGLIDFVQHKLGEDVHEFLELFGNRHHGYSAYAEVLEDTVLGLCRDWYSAMDPILMLVEMRVKLGFSDFERNWLVYGSTCSRITRYSQTILRESFKIVHKMRRPRLVGQKPATRSSFGGKVSSLFKRICARK